MALDAMLVHQLLPLAAGLSAAGLSDAQADVLSGVWGGGTAGAAAAEAVQTALGIQAGLLAACGGDAACDVAHSSATRLIVKVSRHAVTLVHQNALPACCPEGAG